jgi:hypothetical protein
MCVCASVVTTDSCLSTHDITTHAQRTSAIHTDVLTAIGMRGCDMRPLALYILQQVQMQSAGVSRLIDFIHSPGHTTVQSPQTPTVQPSGAVYFPVLNYTMPTRRPDVQTYIPAAAGADWLPPLPDVATFEHTRLRIVRFVSMFFVLHYLL